MTRTTDTIVLPTVATKAALLKRSGLALIAAGIIAVLVVLPAEYGIDPTGFGAVVGLTALSRHDETLATPKPEVNASISTTSTAVPATMAHSSAVPYRSDIIDIPLAATEPGYELEYKVRMKAGDTMVYSWTSPENVYYDFHGESDDKPKPRVISYRIEDDAKQSYGALTAPYDGIHGWYLQNHADKPIVVRLKLSGYYELIDKTRSNSK